jgi:hypothetical protein
MLLAGFWICVWNICPTTCDIFQATKYSSVVMHPDASPHDDLCCSMEAKPNTDLALNLPPDHAAASLVLPGDDEPSLKTFSLDSYAEDEAQHARCSYVTQGPLHQGI